LFPRTYSSPVTSRMWPSWSKPLPAHRAWTPLLWWISSFSTSWPPSCREARAGAAGSYGRSPPRRRRSGTRPSSTGPSRSS
ncbi:hypothetical protein CRUP_017030, partial [Coryphaenoides rupestris]